MDRRRSRRTARALGGALLVGVALACAGAFAVPTGRTLFEASSGAATDTLEVAVDLEGPEVTVTSPPAGSVIGGGSVTFSGTVRDRYHFEDPPGPSLPVATELIWSVVDEGLGMVIDTGRVPLVDGRFTVPDLTLPDGEYFLEAVAMDAAGNVGFGGVWVVSDPNAPAMALVSPQDGEAVLAAEVAVDLNFAAPTTLVAVNGSADGRSFPPGFAAGALTLPLAFGPNVFTLDVESGGAAFQFSFTLFRVDELGQVRIESSLEGKVLNTPTITVRGTVSLGTPLVEVNGIPAVIGADGVSFEVAGIPIREGVNTIRAVAYPLGRETLVTVTGDFTAPRFLAWMPEDGTATTAPEVTVAGFLSEGATVELVGSAGGVSGSATFAGAFGSGPFSTASYRFDLDPLLLDPGPNLLVMRATDAAGNFLEETFTLTRADGALLFAGPTVAVPALRADITLEALEPVTLVAWYAGGRRLPALEGGTLSSGLAPVPNIPLLPGANAMRVVYQRAGGASEVLTFEVESTASEVAVVEGLVTDTATGLPIAGALVQITVNGVTLAVVTDANGGYRVEVEPGPFMVAAVGEGYSAGGASGTGASGGTAVADVALAPTGLPGIQNQVAIVVPPDGTVTDFEHVTVVGTVLNPGSVVSVNGIAAEVVGSRFTARHVPLAMGGNTLHVTATALGSPVATDSVAVERADEPVLAVKIYSPPEGVTIPGSGLVVRGFVSAREASVTVRGAPAVMPIEGTFDAFDVFPARGEPTVIEALASLPNGASRQSAVTIQMSSAESALTLLPDDPDGIAPLETVLRLRVERGPLAVARIDYDIDGDRSIDLPASSMFSFEGQFAETRPYFPRAFVTTPEGAELTAGARVHTYLPSILLSEFAAGNPVDLAEADDGGIYVLDQAAGTVSRYAADGSLQASFGSGGGGSAHLSSPSALAVADDGRVYVADTGNDRIVVFTPLGVFEREIGGTGTDQGELHTPQGVAVKGDILFVSDTGNSRVQIFDLEGISAGTFPLPNARGAASLLRRGLVVASSTSGLHALEATKNDTLIPQQELLEALPESLHPQAPVDIAEADDRIAILDAAAARILVLSPDLVLQRRVDTNLAGARAVLPSSRRDVEAIFVADGRSVREIGIPAPSPLPAAFALRDRIAAADIEGALDLVHPTQRPLFRRIYEGIEADLPIEASFMQGFRVDTLREDRSIVILESESEIRGAMVPEAFPMGVGARGGRALVGARVLTENLVEPGAGLAAAVAALLWFVSYPTWQGFKDGRGGLRRVGVFGLGGRPWVQDSVQGCGLEKRRGG